jgi:hypothetical protein
MDQNIYFEHAIDFAAGAVTEYFVVPYDCTLRDVAGVAQGAIGDDETVTVTTEPTVGGTSTTLGVLTFAGTVAAGDVGAWVADTTDGGHKLFAGEFIKLVTSAGSAAKVNLTIELDPYAR